MNMEARIITPIEQYIIDKVRKMRLEKGISQRDLSRLLDLTDGFIGKVETPKERAKYNFQHVNEIAKIFKCSPKDFLPDEPL
jgi:transcriptional regulator with XRE-family HTH domain